MKQCVDCRKYKTASKFPSARRNTRKKPEVSSRCRPCHNKRHKEKYARPYRAKNRERYDTSIRVAMLRQQYGLTLEQYAEMFCRQNGVCAICGKPETSLGKGGKVKPLAVDHCHETGKIRGLLCQLHNTGLGVFDDNPELLEKAIQYLKDNK